jgi:Tfp pilus assembly protein PilZ
MSQERRAAPRARVPGSFVHCEAAAGERIQAEALNISSGGLFIPTAKPLTIGKRLFLKIQMGGVSAPWWTALARVIWVREAGATGGPPGMGVKLLDIEEEGAMETITRLVDERLKAHPVKAPARERTMLGVGAGPAAAPAPRPAAAPAATGPDADSERPTIAGEVGAPAITAPKRERTVMGMGVMTPATRAAVPRPPTRERSVVEPDPAGWDVPTRAAFEPMVATPAVIVAPSVVVPPAPAPIETSSAKPVEPAPPVIEARAVVEPPAAIEQPPPPPPAPASPLPPPPAPAASRSEPPDSDSSLVAAGVPRRGGGGRLVLLLILLMAGGAGYVLRDRWLPRAEALLTQLTGAPTPAPAPSVPSATPSAPTPPSASVAPSASASASTAASALGSSAASAPRANASSTASASASGSTSAPSASVAGAPAVSASTGKPPARPVVIPPAPPPLQKSPDNPY